LVTPSGARPSVDEIIQGKGGLCDGSTDTSSPTFSAECSPVCGQMYDVWVVQVPVENGVGSIMLPMKTLTPPCENPQAFMFAHSPSESGAKITYDIEYPIATGKFYWKTLPSGSAAPSLDSMRQCANYECCGSDNQVVSGGVPGSFPMQTLIVNCQLVEGTYVVFGAVDTDGQGKDLTFANPPSGFPFTYTKPTPMPRLHKPALTQAPEEASHPHQFNAIYYLLIILSAIVGLSICVCFGRLYRKERTLDDEFLHIHLDDHSS